MPNRLQRVDSRGDHAAGRFPIRRGNKAHTAGIALKFGPIHAFAGEAFVFGGEIVCVGHDFFFSFWMTTQSAMA